MRASTYDMLKASCQKRVGSTIDDKYLLEELLGLGGSGAVYRARNTWAGKPCALKLFYYEGQRRDAVLKRFMREAQACNRILKDGVLHPNVVDAFDVGKDRATGCFFVVQELLQGETLGAFIDRQPGRRVEATEAARMLLPVIDAIAVAHEAGIVHRDLKPENIYLVPRPAGGVVVPKVLDFGIAQLSDDRMTSGKETLGTPEYMPPEAFEGARYVDARADVWAFGVMLYEMIAGESPFGDRDEVQARIVYRISTLEPPSLAQAGLMSPGLWAVVQRCLTKDPAGRYANGRELQQALELALAPVYLLRVPPGMSPAALQAALQRPGPELSDMLRPSNRGDEAPPVLPEDPARAWWKLVFPHSSMAVTDVLDVLAFPELANLLEVHFVGTVLGDMGVWALAQSPRLSNLTGLSFRGAGIGPAGVQALVDSPWLSGLVGLHIEDCPIGSEGVRVLVQATSMPALRLLALVADDIDTAGAEALAEAPLLAELRRLDLSRNRIGDDGAWSLVHSPHLTDRLTLILKDNEIDELAAEAVAERLAVRVRKAVL